MYVISSLDSTEHSITTIDSNDTESSDMEDPVFRGLLSHIKTEDEEDIKGDVVRPPDDRATPCSGDCVALQEHHATREGDEKNSGFPFTIKIDTHSIRTKRMCDSSELAINKKKEKHM
ncbi:hypothetical protein DdX_02922 [Ditylenchus destructor]|uniref:Uncharacterized protein n=1 Tax=Ditylenchus destructor TaxID=166010 RepID=A0AAD4NC37_9BILA|nr:hypothetical protein DdX_02922 [Ditylenchus destructor]